MSSSEGTEGEGRSHQAHETPAIILIGAGDSRVAITEQEQFANTTAGVRTYLSTPAKNDTVQ